MSTCIVRVYKESDLPSVREIFTTGCCEHIFPTFRHALRQPHNWLLLLVAHLLPLVTTGSLLLSILSGASVSFILWFPGRQFFYLYAKKALSGDLTDIRKYYLEKEGHGFWVVELEGEVVGMVAAVPVNTRYEKNVELKRMSVSRNHRGKGIAKLLCRAVIDFARRSGYKAVILSTTTVQVDGLKLYEKMGFKRSDTDEQNPLLFRLIGMSWVGYRYDISTSR
ncbi:putative N-acetyltransferase 8B [Leptodactylus fuscus]|uniref:N-acetyltransferase 8B-like n=1 Tax=Leptodactylus fuscus TaxID=238119 RepID=UPI003F4E8BB2